MHQRRGEHNVVPGKYLLLLQRLLKTKNNQKHFLFHQLLTTGIFLDLTYNLRFCFVTFGTRVTLFLWK
jgi:hypothetical protein